MRSKHADAPLGTRPSDSRFCADAFDFTVLYAAPEFTTAFVEVLVRDRFTRRRDRRISLEALKAHVWSVISSARELSLIDLRGDGCVQVGAPTDVVNARNHAAGRAFASDIHRAHEKIDGLVFPSRLTGGDIYAIFSRAIGDLHATETVSVIDHPELEAVFERYDIAIGFRD